MFVLSAAIPMEKSEQNIYVFPRLFLKARQFDKVVSVGENNIRVCPYKIVSPKLTSENVGIRIVSRICPTEHFINLELPKCRPRILWLSIHVFLRHKICQMFGRDINQLAAFL